jgi:hypothetical protein
MLMRLESYTHRFAKEVLRDWFYSGQIKNVHYNNPEVFLEYAVINNFRYNSVNHLWNLGGNKNPSFDECVRVGLYPKRVVDVLLASDGFPTYFIEVRHKCPVSVEKIEDMKMLGVKILLEVDAGWIMKQVRPPKYLQYKRLI